MGGCLLGRPIPFTWHRKDYSNGKIVKESECINTSSADELNPIYSITKVLVEKVVAFRKATGLIEGVEKLRQVKGLQK